ncbi:ATP-binding cassette domain-containing protein [Flammeovirga sp. EKP202]|uniref:ATP-binding cassette domain-containing protein n=1 Tax=Flammeovirga sp. EKP202 TaxID=2770592 RepID=UPI00165FB401|nr:ATP-binding cassette domain-containing protein [Flammeovirga sp. EKP202]
MIHISLYKKINKSKVQSQFQLEFDLGDIIGITGPSGKGKTTFLKVIAGLMDCEKGRIIFNDTVWLDTTSKVQLSPQKRNIGFVFQDYALFPNMNVIQNISFAQNEKFEKEELERLIDAFEIRSLLKQKVNTLSGGQKQRVAIARALVQLPHLLLMDEPFSALDFRVKQRVIDYIMHFQSKHHTPLLINTHQIHELEALTQHIYELNDFQLQLLDMDARIQEKAIVTQINIEERTMEVELDRRNYVLPLKKGVVLGEQIHISIE